MFRGTLRTKFLFSTALISALLTFATLLLVRQRVEIHAREAIDQDLRNSVATFQTLQQQRESTLERSAALLASLPTLKALMTSQDPLTIQDASKMFWELAGSQLFVLADRGGTLMALHTSMPGFSSTEAQDSLRQSLSQAQPRDWWYGSGRLFEVFVQPIYFGARDENTQIGVVAVGYEIDDRVASDISRVASGPVAFQYGEDIVVTTVSPAQKQGLARALHPAGDLELDGERFLGTSVRLSSGNSAAVTLTVLKSYDQATLFLRSLNRWIVAVGIAAVVAGSLLVFFVSTTFTRPLAELVAGVHALEAGDFAYPLNPRGDDEVSRLTGSFQRMRLRLQETQRQLLDSERLATIGRMATTISHDLRHPLTAILAYAEFLSEGNVQEEQRKDFFQEIRIAVNRMTDELNSLVGFSKEREAIRPVHARMDDVIERALQSVRVLPEFEAITFKYTRSECRGWFDPAKVERVLLNLLFNACEAVDPKNGQVEISCRASDGGLEIHVSDNGPGIPEEIRGNLFQPFVSSGKEQGIGLGLTVVQKIVQDHGGEVMVERTGPGGTEFRLLFPAVVGQALSPAS